MRTDFSNADFGAGASTVFNDKFIGVGFEYTHGQRSDFTQLFNFPTGVIQPGDIAILSQRGNSKVIYNNFNLFFGVTQLL